MDDDLVWFGLVDEKASLIRIIHIKSPGPHKSCNVWVEVSEKV